MAKTQRNKIIQGLREAIAMSDGSASAADAGRPQVQDAETKAARIKVLTALRDDLAATTGPSDTLDCRISEVVFGEFRTSHFTASIDAAVTLVPSRYTNDWDAGVVDEVRAPDDIQTRNYAHIGNTECWGATPALALCLARIEYELAAITEREA